MFRNTYCIITLAIITAAILSCGPTNLLRVHRAVDVLIETETGFNKEQQITFNNSAYKVTGILLPGNFKDELRIFFEVKGKPESDHIDIQKDHIKIESEDYKLKGLRVFKGTTIIFFDNLHHRTNVKNRHKSAERILARELKITVTDDKSTKFNIKIKIDREELLSFLGLNGKTD